MPKILSEVIERANKCYKEQKYKEALAAYEEAFSLPPYYPFSGCNERDGNLVDTCRKLAAEQKKDTKVLDFITQVKLPAVYKHLMKAGIEYHDGHYENAISEYEKTINLVADEKLTRGNPVYYDQIAKQYIGHSYARLCLADPTLERITKAKVAFEASRKVASTLGGASLASDYYHTAGSFLIITDGLKKVGKIKEAELLAVEAKKFAEEAISLDKNNNYYIRNPLATYYASFETVDAKKQIEALYASSLQCVTTKGNTKTHQENQAAVHAVYKSLLKKLADKIAGAQQKISAEAKLKADCEAKEKADKAKAEQDKLIAKDQKLADKDKELAAQAKKLAEMEAKLKQMELQQQNNSTKPNNDLFVSFVIPYNELQIGEKLGAGGFGVVHKGTWRFQNVAIKELLDEKPSPAVATDFKNEMQMMAKLRSSNVVQFYGCVLGNPKYCIVMEYMPKGSLFNLLRSNQTLDWSTRYKMSLDMACGLAFLHAENILHRDLKSLNVLLDEHYHAKLTDFGLSKVKTETKTTTKTQQSVGSEGWIAPELTDPDGKDSQKSDVFSMGITMWEIASRKIPYETAKSRAMIPFWMAQGKREDIPTDCPPKMAHLIKWCWDTDPTKRPTAAEAVKYLRDAENDFKPSNNKPNQNDNAAQVNNLASGSFAASYQPNSVVPANKK